MDMNKRSIILLLSLLALLDSCRESTDLKNKDMYYSMQDLSTVEKYDTHVHLNTKDTSLIHLARELNFKLLSLNVAAPEYPSLEQQQQFTMEHRNNFPGEVAYATSFYIEHIDDSAWQEKTINYLRQSFKNGAIGVKVWKNIGMEYTSKSGKFVMIDDPRLDSIFNFIEQNNCTLIGHLGEPKNCWLPLEKMTVKNDKDYFKGHPEYHMYLHPEFPTYEDQLNARDHMLEKHPALRFDGAHLGSLEWSVDELAKRLDKFPNMAVDMAERISHIQYQAIKDHKKVYDFFIKYQDRLLYATDIVIDDSTDKQKTLTYARETWTNHWKFFTSDQMMEAPELEEQFQALHLPKDVIDKLYRKNAEKWFPGFTPKQ